MSAPERSRSRFTRFRRMRGSPFPFPASRPPGLSRLRQSPVRPAFPASGKAPSARPLPQESGHGRMHPSIRPESKKRPRDSVRDPVFHCDTLGFRT